MNPNYSDKHLFHSEMCYSVAIYTIYADPLGFMRLRTISKRFYQAVKDLYKFFIRYHFDSWIDKPSFITSQYGIRMITDNVHPRADHIHRVANMLSNKKCGIDTSELYIHKFLPIEIIIGNKYTEMDGIEVIICMGKFKLLLKVLGERYIPAQKIDSQSNIILQFLDKYMPEVHEAIIS
jgi:hypothetical protein